MSEKKKDEENMCMSLRSLPSARVLVFDRRALSNRTPIIGSSSLHSCAIIVIIGLRQEIWLSEIREHGVTKSISKGVWVEICVG